jgi:hypothetical protein
MNQARMQLKASHVSAAKYTEIQEHPRRQATMPSHQSKTSSPTRSQSNAVAGAANKADSRPHEGA